MLLPWAVCGGALVLYLLTLNHWVSLSSLPLVAKVTGWDWVLPHQSPLFFLLTYPFRWLPVGVQPVALNALSAVWAGLTLLLLARSVMLLPQDRTHEQRQRERSEFSLLMIPGSWLPPLLAALVCGLEITFWEHSTVATGEMLDLLVFAYVIRCLLEFRMEQRDSWLYRFAFVYALGITNNWALIGFLPLFLGALLWIKGTECFQFQFLVRMIAWGVGGLLLYLLLPIVWAMANHPSVTFWDALRGNLAAQKSMLFNIPSLRIRALALSLTAILPVIIIGIRWPASFGDTSAAGSALTQIMLRLIHVLFFGACLWVAFGQKFSPRSLGYGLPFLTFYYLGALSVGYFSGYLMLICREQRGGKSWHRRSSLGNFLAKGTVALVWIVAVAVPAALVAINFSQIRSNDGTALRQMAEASSKGLPEKGGIVLSDDPYTVLLLAAQLSTEGTPQKHVLVHTRALANLDYHRQLAQRHPQRWPLMIGEDLFDDGTLVQMLTDLARTNSIHYMHPSFGYYFERFDTRQKGLGYELTLAPTNSLSPVRLSAEELASNQEFWDKQMDYVSGLGKLKQSRDGMYVQVFMSRALNAWAVALQRHKKLAEASKYFEAAAALNTNNIPAYINLQYNKALRGGGGATNLTAKAVEDRFGPYRSWEVLADNGPFDHPEFTLRLADIFLGQNLLRQAMTEYRRVAELDAENVAADIGIANVFLQAGRPEQTIEWLRELRVRRSASLGENGQIELIRMEANAEFARKDSQAAGKLLVDARARHPKSLAILDTLVQFYAQERRFPEAIEALDALEKLAPNNPQVQMNRATIYFNTKNNAKALETLDEILLRDAKNIPAQLYKTYILLQQQEYDKALQIVGSVLRVDAENVEGLTYMGVIAISQKRYEDAIEPLSKVLTKNPNDSNALRNRAIAYLQKSDMPKARRDYTLLAQLAPRSYVAYYGLAEIAYREKQMDLAVRNYERYLKNFPPESAPELEAEKKQVLERLNQLKPAQR